MTGGVLYIGEDLHYNLPEEEQEKYETWERYKPDFIGQCIHDHWDNDFSDAVFKSLGDYEDFWGDDFSNTGGSVYSKEFRSLYLYSEEQLRKYFEPFSKGVKGNQIRIKHDWKKEPEIRDCVVLGWNVFTNLTGKDGNSVHYDGSNYANSKRGFSKYLIPTLVETFDGDRYFKDKKELAEFFGISEELKELDGRKLGKTQARTFTKRLTDEEKKSWMDKAIDGNQVKVIEVWS